MTGWYGFGIPAGTAGVCTAPGRDWVTGVCGAPGCACGGIMPGGYCPGNCPGNCPAAGLPCGGIATLIGSSASSIGCGGRWKVGGIMLLAVAAGARLVAMIVTRS